MTSSPSASRPPGGRHRARRLTALLGAVICVVALAACIPDHTDAGTVLHAGDKLQSSNGYVAYMQGDGNFVVYNPSGTAVWNTHTAGHPGAHLSVQVDGNVVLYASNGDALWSTKTASRDMVPSKLVMQGDGNLVLYAGTVALWSSKGGLENCYGSGCRVLSSYETDGHGSLAGRDCGYSAKLPTAGKSMWLFCDTPVRPTGGSLGMISGSTAAKGSYHPFVAPESLTELPSGDPTRFLPVPTGLKLLNGQPCGSDGNSYAASWATGLTPLPSNPEILLIPFGNYCVQGPGSGQGMWFKGYGIAEYNANTGQLLSTQNVMTGSSYLHDLGAPTYDAATNALYFFGQHCSSPAYGACAASTTFVARVNLGSNPMSTKPWRVDTNYLYYKGNNTWTPHSTGTVSILPANLTALTAKVQRVQSLGNQLVMLQQTDIGAGYRILTASSPAGPWSEHSSGQISDCQNVPSGTWCYAYNLHDELSTQDRLAITVFNPARKHVTLEMIPW